MSARYIITMAAIIVLTLVVGCGGAEPTAMSLPPTAPPVPPTTTDVPPTATAVRPTDTPLPKATPASTVLADGVVQGWAVLAEKDDYSDVSMTDLLVDYINIAQMRQVLEEAGWAPDRIHEMREFDRESLRDELAWLSGVADQDDIAFLYVGAHGRYLSNVISWGGFFAADWEQISSHRRLLVVDACQAANYTDAVSKDPEPHLSIAASDGGEFGWWGIEEEGLPIIGGVFTHYFAAAFSDPEADTDGNGLVSVQEAALMAEGQQRTYMHEVVFAVPEFVEMYNKGGVFPEKDPEYPDVVLDDAIGEPLYLALDVYASEPLTGASPADTPIPLTETPTPTATPIPLTEAPTPTSTPTVTPIPLTATPIPPTPTPLPATDTVCAAGCDFTTIQAALDDAGTPAGAIIEVTDPIHTEAGIVVDKDVTIRGLGAGDTIVQAHGTPDKAPDRVFLVEEGATVFFEKMTIRHGKPSEMDEHGGGIMNHGALTLSNCVVTNNVAGGGAGICTHGELTLINSTVSDNTARSSGQPGSFACGGGGGIRCGRGTLTLINSTVSGNRAGTRSKGTGGGLRVGCTCTAEFTNSTISGNRSLRLGGGVVVMGTLQMVNCTISNNTTQGEAGGVYVKGALDVVNTLIANNTGAGGNCVVAGLDEYGVEGTLGTNTNNLVEDSTCSPETSGDPMLGPLADNGGDTKTHALLPGSPAIDVIPVGECPVGTDQRGYSRPQGAACDIGAFELQVDE
jgi:hypothetical protein